ncbi:MAG: tyrosine-type recombinase/integrase [Acidobacteriota bacterium]
MCGHSTSDNDKTLGWLVERFPAEYRSRKGTSHYHKRSNKTRHASGIISLDDAGQPVKARWLSWALRDTMKAAGISGASFRNFRHTFATRAVKGGIHAKTTGEMLGDSMESVAERYMHTAARAASLPVAA